jgi:hypothetical protein
VRRFIVELSGLALLSSSLCVAACSGGGGACDVLSACCASLAGAQAQECSSAISQSGATGAQCAMVLSTYQSAGACKSSGNASGGSVSFNPEGEGGIPTDPCASLTTCCPNVPVAGDPMACMPVAMDGTAKACLESLESYASAGYCAGLTFPNPKVGTHEVEGGSGSGGEVDGGRSFGGGSTTCFELTGTGTEMSCVQTMTPGAECTTLAAKAMNGVCPTTGLYGCCVQPVSSSPGTLVAECVYSERVAMALESHCPAPGYWQTTAP